MPHSRNRFAEGQIRKLASFWPVVGVLGLRQVGKSTLLRDQIGKTIGISRYLTLDEDDVLSEALASAKVFLSRLDVPALIDEVQKAPALFDGIKALVDRKRVPGQYFLTGSSAFSAKLGIRESLTGRIGLIHLFPLTLAEAGQKPFRAVHKPFHSKNTRFTVAEFARGMERGGLPVPLFLRDRAARELYWTSWLETCVIRDVGKVFGKNYDPDVTWKILRMIARTLENGEFVTSAQIDIPSQRRQKYLDAMEAVFLIRKLPCDERGVGKDAWLLGDSGLAFHLMGYRSGEGVTLSLARHYWFHEISALLAYSGHPGHLTYFKSQRGTPVDLVWDGVPIKVIATSHGPLGWEVRSLEGAMKALKSDRSILVAPRERPALEKRGVSVVPWTYWS